MAAAYYWLPKWTGYMYNETLGKWHFWTSTIFVNLTFFPMHFLGLAGMPRRIPDYSTQFADFNYIASVGAIGFGLSQLIFIWVLLTTKKGEKATDRVWEAPRGLEWTVPSPALNRPFPPEPCRMWKSSRSTGNRISRISGSVSRELVMWTWTPDVPLKPRPSFMRPAGEPEQMVS